MRFLFLLVGIWSSMAGAQAFSPRAGFWQSRPVTAAIVQHTSTVGSNSIALAFPSAVKAGDLLIACTLSTQGYTVTISDNRNNFWFTGPSDSVASKGLAICWYVEGAIAGSTTVTATYSGGSNDNDFELLEVSGGYIYFDQSGSGHGTGLTATATTTGPVSSPNEYVFAFGGDWDNSATWTKGTGFTIEDTSTSAGSQSSAMEDNLGALKPLNGTQTATFTKNDTTDTWQELIMTFRGSDYPTSVQFRAAGAVSACDSGSSCDTLSMPAGVQSGDLLIAQLEIVGNSTVGAPFGYTAPSGWTLFQSNYTGGGVDGEEYFYYRIAGSSEPATYSWTFNDATYVNGETGAIVAYYGVNTSSPIDAHACAMGTVSPSTSATITTTTKGDKLLFSIVQTNSHGGLPAQPGGMTQRYGGTSADNALYNYLYDRTLGAAQTTAAISENASIGNDWYSCQIALKPAVPPP